MSFRCEHHDAVGGICAKTFTRKWNLDRHRARTHSQVQGRIFIHYNPSQGGFPEEHPEVVLESATISTLDLVTIDEADDQPSQEEVVDLSCDQERQFRASGLPALNSQPRQNPAPSISPAAYLDPPPISLRTPAQERRDKRKRRLCDSLDKETLPNYQVKRSKQWPRQQKALLWLTQEGKDRFDCSLATILARWGVHPTHHNTCVLWPADWTALDPLRVSAIFDISKCPRKTDDGAAYQHGDHLTTYTRAKAWFADYSWPRTGAELDNFLGCGPFKSKEGSHLCHQHLCLVHVIFEDPDINEGRKCCHARAKFLRQEGSPVPKHCQLHEPPCLMQHAALTMLEVILVQLHTLRQAKGLGAAISAPRRPQWHPYSTFELQLPLMFSQAESAINLHPQDLNNKIIPVDHESRPELLCNYCPKIKAFKGIVALWAHLVHHHYQVGTKCCTVPIEEEFLLKEVTRTAHLWNIYLAQQGEGGRRRDPTIQKLREARGNDFTWRTVLNWKL